MNEAGNRDAWTIKELVAYGDWHLEFAMGKESIDGFYRHRAHCLTQKWIRPLSSIKQSARSTHYRHLAGCTTARGQKETWHHQNLLQFCMLHTVSSTTPFYVTQSNYSVADTREGKGRRTLKCRTGRVCVLIPSSYSIDIGLIDLQVWAKRKLEPTKIKKKVLQLTTN